MMSKVTKGKEKTRGKKGKSQNELRSKTTNQHTALYFVQGWYLHKEKETLFFNIKYGKFWLDGDFIVRNLNASVKLP